MSGVSVASDPGKDQSQLSCSLEKMNLENDSEMSDRIKEKETSDEVLRDINALVGDQPEASCGVGDQAVPGVDHEEVVGEDDMIEIEVYDAFPTMLEKCSTIGVFVEPYVPPLKELRGLGLKPTRPNTFAIVEVDGVNDVGGLTKALVGEAESEARNEFVDEYVSGVSFVFPKTMAGGRDWRKAVKDFLKKASFDDLFNKDKLVLRWFIHEDMVDNDERGFDQQCYDLANGEALSYIFRQRDEHRSLKLRVFAHFASGIVLPARIIGQFFSVDLGKMIDGSEAHWKIDEFGSIILKKSGEFWIVHPQSRWNEILVPGDIGTLELFPDDEPSLTRDTTKLLNRIEEMEISWRDVSKQTIKEYVLLHRSSVKDVLNRYEDKKVKRKFDGMVLLRQKFFGAVVHWRKHYMIPVCEVADASTSGGLKRGSEGEDEVEGPSFFSTVMKKKAKTNGTTSGLTTKASNDLPFNDFFKDCEYGLEKFFPEELAKKAKELGKWYHFHTPCSFFDRIQGRKGFSIKGYFDRARYYKKHHAYTLNLKGLQALSRYAHPEPVPWKFGKIEPQDVVRDRDTWNDQEHLWFGAGITPVERREGFRGWGRTASSNRRS